MEQSFSDKLLHTDTCRLFCALTTSNKNVRRTTQYYNIKLSDSYAFQISRYFMKEGLVKIEKKGRVNLFEATEKGALLGYELERLLEELGRGLKKWIKFY